MSSVLNVTCPPPVSGDTYDATCQPSTNSRRSDMRKLIWILAASSSIALLSVAAAQAAPGSPAHHGPATVLNFDTMAPVTGPYVGSANPVRGIPGGGLPWMLKSATGSLKRNGHVLVVVRGLVLANQPSVPPALRGTNPITHFRAIVSCQSIGAGNAATVANVSTRNFKASKDGNARIDARVKVPRPCIAPIVFVTAPAGNDVWFAATGS